MERCLYEQSIRCTHAEIQRVQQDQDGTNLRKAIRDCRVALDEAGKLPNVLFDLPSYEQQFFTNVVEPLRKEAGEEIALLREFLPGNKYAGQNVQHHWDALQDVLQLLREAGVDDQTLFLEVAQLRARLTIALPLTQDPASVLSAVKSSPADVSI